MNSFILKGNIGYSIAKTELKTVSGYVVCRDGKCAGVFEDLPEEYKNLNLRQRLERAFIYRLICVAALKKNIYTRQKNYLGGI
jgi:hypothetical protein